MSSDKSIQDEIWNNDLLKQYAWWDSSITKVSGYVAKLQLETSKTTHTKKEQIFLALIQYNFNFKESRNHFSLKVSS